MPNYRTVIFDLDGTVADTAPGILACHQFVAKSLGLPPRTPEQLDGIIGGALDTIYTGRFGMTESDAVKAIDIYRRHYSEAGIKMAKLYSGMHELLSALHDSGVFVAIATLKRKDFARQMMKDLGVSHLFHEIQGVDAADRLKKHDLIQLCLEKSGHTAQEAILIGDSKNDANGAQKAGVKMIAVTYGYGFEPDTDFSDYPQVINHAASVKELQDILLP